MQLTIPDSIGLHQIGKCKEAFPRETHPFRIEWLDFPLPITFWVRQQGDRATMGNLSCSW